MAAPHISGLTALMFDACNMCSSLTYWVEPFGKSGFDPVYGNGLILAHYTIKQAGGFTSGSFNDYRDHYNAVYSISAGQEYYYQFEVYQLGAYFATTLIMTDEDCLPGVICSDDFDLRIWKPGKDPLVDSPNYTSARVLTADGSPSPQEHIRFLPPVTGVYTVGIKATSGSGGYAIDFVGQIQQ